MIRPHLGTDYAAAAGTPVRAGGGGIITFRGRKRGYGKMIVIRHNARYQTLYSHMRDFVPGLEAGDRVRQGEVIGYVGQTGLASGPHLHYAVKVDGRFRNPRTVLAPERQALPEDIRQTLLTAIAPLEAALQDLIDPSTTVAES